MREGVRVGSESSSVGGFGGSSCASKGIELRAWSTRGLKINNNNNKQQRMVSMHIYYAASYAQIVGTQDWLQQKLLAPCDVFGSLRRI